MLAGWVKFMPFFVVVWLSKRHCERFNLMPGHVTTEPFKDVCVSWRLK